MKQEIIKMSAEDRQKFIRAIGLAFSLIGQALLKSQGIETNFKINGEDIEDIEKLMAMDISDRIALAVKEERYEDAFKLKQLLDKKK